MPSFRFSFLGSKSWWCTLLSFFVSRLKFLVVYYTSSAELPRCELPVDSSTHMGSLFRFPYLPESFSLPSLPQLRSPNPPPVHRHLVPRPLKTPSSSASLSSLLEGFPPTRSDFNYPIFETGQQPSAEQADRGETFDPRPKKIFKNCSLCHDPIPNGVEPCTFPRTAPAALAALTPHLPLSIEPKIFCHACWVWIHNLSICWICGETVSRKEERVSYGWCWWHWGCVSCLLCRVSIFLTNLLYT